MQTALQLSAQVISLREKEKILQLLVVLIELVTLLQRCVILDEENVLVGVWVPSHFEAVYLHHYGQLGHWVPHLDVLLVLQSTVHPQELFKTKVLLVGWASKDLYFDVC